MVCMATNPVKWCFLFLLFCFKIKGVMYFDGFKHFNFTWCRQHIIVYNILKIPKYNFYWENDFFSQSALPLSFHEDVNECRQKVCRPDQHCKNTRGGYKCIDLCPNGMTKAENGSCIGECLAVSMTEIHLSSTSQVRPPFLKLMILVNFE